MLQQKLPGKQSDGQSASSAGSLIDQYFGMVQNHADEIIIFEITIINWAMPF